MAKFVLVYTGGASMGDTPEDQQAMMEAWMAWFGSLGESVLDLGNPFGASCAVTADGSVSDGGPSGLSGYSIIEAESAIAAADKAKTCPVLSGGGAIEIYEALPIG
jgi:hypothetical protein